MKRLQIPYYFAYNTDLCTRSLINKVGAVEKVGEYRLPGYRLSFDAGDKLTAIANIQESFKTSFVEGMLFRLSDVQIATLDSLTGFPYLFSKISGALQNGETFFTYTAQSKHITTKTPTPFYILTLIQGCTEHGLVVTKSILQGLFTGMTKDIDKKFTKSTDTIL